MTKKFPLPAWAAVLIALLGGITLAASIGNDDNGKPSATVTIHLDGPGKQTVELPRGAAAPALATQVGDHDGSRAESPPGVSPEALNAGQEQQDRLAASDQLPIVTPDAAPSVAGCRSRFVANYSTRRGVRPRLLVVHYTVSPNRPGWSDVNAIVSLFNQPRFAASSTYVIDNEGHCAYIVRESDKAWTQAGFNPVSISVELINSGREKTLAGKAGLAKLGSVFAGAARRWEIPLQHGKVSGCSVLRAGIVDHNTLKACGGGHVDVTPYKVGPVIAAARTARCSKRGTSSSRKRCRRTARAS